MSSKGDAGARRCVYCRKQAAIAPFLPFCSEGCRSRDLNAWLSDAYVIPGSSHEDELSDVTTLDNGEEAG